MTNFEVKASAPIQPVAAGDLPLLHLSGAEKASASRRSGLESTEAGSRLRELLLLTSSSLLLPPPLRPA